MCTLLRSRFQRMTRRTLHGALAFSLGAVFAACDSPSSPSSVNGLRLFVEVTPTTIPAGSNGIIAANLRNVGNSMSTINLSSGCASLIRVFRYPSNESVPVAVACAAVVVPVTLGPGDTYNQSLQIRAGTAPPDGIALPPGEYYTIASSEHSDVPTLRSESVRFTVQ